MDFLTALKSPGRDIGCVEVAIMNKSKAKRGKISNNSASVISALTSGGRVKYVKVKGTEGRVEAVKNSSNAGRLCNTINQATVSLQVYTEQQKFMRNSTAVVNEENGTNWWRDKGPLAQS